MAAKKQPRKKPAKKPAKRSAPKSTAKACRSEKTYAEHERRRKSGVDQADRTPRIPVPPGAIRTPAAKKGVSKREAFLEAFKICASVSRAAAAVKIERGLHYRWLEEPEYAKAFEAAKKEALQTLVDEAVKRATDGVLEPVFYQGVVCGFKRNVSDSNLQFLIRAWDPATYRERSSVEHTGPGGGPIEVSTKEKALAELLTPEQLAELKRKLEQAEKPADA